MLFDTISESTLNTNWDEIEPSKYEANLEGALMLVYENECNYNALMRAAGLSELKYYQETGEDLFIQEAGAFGGFLAKAKAFFQKIIEKIKALFKKFFMTINQFIMTDKQWVKKYEKDILRVTNIKDMEFKGYTFSDFESTTKKIMATCTGVINAEATQLDNISKLSHADYTPLKDEDAVTDYIEERRGKLINKSSMDEAEFRDELKELLYGGEKEILDGSDINLRECLEIIRSSKNGIKAAEHVEKETTKSINRVIKAIDNKIKEFGKVEDAERGTDDKAKALNESKNNAIKALNQKVRINKALSNDLTVACGMICQAIKDCNRQSKAICIKAVSYNTKHKNESAVYSDSDDLFAGVTIR